jgi:hypothetical protein
MKNINQLFSIFIALFFLTSCSSLPSYRQASGNGYGYSESKISDNHFRVHYRLKGKQKSEAMDFVMLRAAELTLLNGFDWFVIVNRETTSESEGGNSGAHIGASSSQHRKTQCGLLACKTTHEPTTSYGIGLELGTTRGEVESLLEIRMGKGVKPDSENSFSAIEVKQNLRRSHQLDNS